MVALSVVACLHAVPHHVALGVGHSDMYYGFIGFEEGTHVVGFWLCLERDVEDTLCPSFHGPSLALAEIVDGSPVSKADGSVAIHSEEILAHCRYACLTLIERHPGEACLVAWEVHVAVVIGLEIGNHSQIAGQGVSLPVAVSGVHGYCHLARGVIALYEGAHELELGHAEVVERHIVVGLQLVAHRPRYDTRVVAVTGDEFWHMLLPEIHEVLSACAHILVIPLVVEFVNNENAVLVADVEEAGGVGVMRGAYMVHAKFLHQLYALLYGLRIGRSAECSEGVVVGISLEQHFLAVEYESLSRYYLNGSDTEGALRLVCHATVLSEQLYLCRIEIGVLAVPQLGISDGYGRQSELLAGTIVAVVLQAVVARVYLRALRVEDSELQGYFLLLRAVLHIG